MNRKTRYVTLVFVLAAACGGTDAAVNTDLSPQSLAGGPFDDTPTSHDRASAELRAEGFFGGTVLSSDLDVERGLSVFEIYVRLPSGAVIEIELEEATGRVVQIESKTGPFTDELDPGPDFVSLAEALAAAGRTEAIVGWELELDDGLAWVWEIEYEGEVRVKVDARSGAIVDDDHGRDPWDDDGFDDDGQQATAPADVVQAAQTVVAGDVVKSERELEHGLTAWKVTLRTAGGAEVDVYLLQEGRSLLRVRDDAGPFDYDVAPGRGWLTLDDALVAANATAGEMERYRLDRENGALVYELRFAERDVRVDATTGAVVED